MRQLLANLVPTSPPLPGAATGSEAVRFERLRGGYKEGEKRVR